MEEAINNIDQLVRLDNSISILAEVIVPSM